MEDNESEIARAAVLEAVEAQITDGNPPETAETLDRLMGLGYDRDEACRLIGCALADEMRQIIEHGREYDPERYLGLLRKLPDMPWE